MSKAKNFSPSRVIAVTWRVLTQISRDKRTLSLMIFVPALIMLIVNAQHPIGYDCIVEPVVVKAQLLLAPFR